MQRDLSRINTGYKLKGTLMSPYKRFDQGTKVVCAMAEELCILIELEMDNLSGEM